MSKKKPILFVLNYKQKKPTFIVFNYVISKNHLFQRKIKCKLHSICSPFHFLYNQELIKIVFTSSYKTYFKDNTRNYVTNYYVLIFLIRVKLFFLLKIWDGGSIYNQRKPVITHDTAINNSKLEDEEDVPRSPIVKIRSSKCNRVKPKWLRDNVQY